MDSIRTNRLVKRAVLALILILLVLSSFLIYQQAHFRIKSTNPGLSDITTLTPFFEIAFNKPLSTSSALISINPQVMYQPIKVSGNLLTIYLSEPLDSTKTYTISLQSISATSGQKINNRQFSFRPKVVSRDKLPEDQQEALIQRNQHSAVYNDPILPHLPHFSVDFTLTSSFGAGPNNQPQLTLQAQLLIHLAQTGNKAEAIAQDKQEVQDYIKSLGLDPNKYSIGYSVVSP